jgi:hypothetical protein
MASASHCSSSFPILFSLLSVCCCEELEVHMQATFFCHLLLTDSTAKPLAAAAAANGGEKKLIESEG